MWEWERGPPGEPVPSGPVVFIRHPREWLLASAGCVCSWDRSGGPGFEQGHVQPLPGPAALCS